MTSVKCGSLVAAATVLLVPGCMTQQAQMIRQDMAAMHDSLHIAIAHQEEILDEIDALSDRLDEHEDLFGQLRADHEADISDLRGENSMTRTNVADNRDRLTSLTQRLEALEHRMAGASLPAGTDTTHSVGPTEMIQAYDRAYLDFTRGKYELAIMGFSEYLKDYPNTERADNALYWIGECHYVQGDYDSAVSAFQKILDTYPKGNKAPGAMLKIALAEANRGRESAAVGALKTVIERYPGTPEAEHAKAKLLSLHE
ncbi:MAG: tol-pal system protein YbgF [Candidatus Eisenbacteria sp.]|nr:tol-pal system protein YbgF [Candidatus Eisenbacteria bacterium]